MKARDLFEGVINNEMPTLDLIDAIEEIGDEGDGVTKTNLELMFSDFSRYLQDYVDIVLKKREADEELIEDYNREENEKFRNAYIIQEYYEDAGLSKNQMHSIINFFGILYKNIERIEHLNSGKATMGELVGDSYKKGMPNSFFTEVYEGNISDSKMYSKVQELTDNFDETKLNILCKDFDFYLFMVEEFESNYSRKEIDEKIKEYHDAGKKLPMLSDRDPSPSQISGFFKTPEHKKIKKEEDWTKEQLESLKKMSKDWEESKKKIIDYERLFDPHGIEYFSLYKLRNLLVDLKRKHTSAEYKFDDNPKGSSFNPFEKALNPEQSDTIKLFESVNSGELSKLDIHNRIQKLTGDYDEEKLNLLVDEFDEYIFVKYENWRASYSQDDIEKRIDKYHDKGIKIPIKGDEKHKYQWPFIRDFFLVERYGKPISDEEHEKHLDELFGEDRNKHDVIDDNVLLGGFYYATDNKYLQDLRDILVKLKKKYTSSVYRFDEKPKDLQVKNNYISWLKSDKSRKQFIEALKEQSLIKARDTEDIIKNHFEPHIEQNGKPEPIEWLETIALLAYMIESLDQQYIKPKNIWNDTAPHFSKNGKTPQHLRQTANRFKQNKTRKPKNHEIIDNIIRSLPE